MQIFILTVRNRSYNGRLRLFTLFILFLHRKIIQMKKGKIQFACIVFFIIIIAFFQYVLLYSAIY